ncbi:hypothetical protein HRS9139_02704 [Pyrenophora teres f. teres]|uniref:Uncharacterized protein n=1 Tax=Pyrenophora teres f. teres TaxID=97479 RepID=A0A6S6WBU6_9PLEO|nr:hypothetical protein HRS9139_02704 [Pyrenophora teres f. teres]CAE7179942.1 hypothetical protein PTTW11_06681 [Pyrenophora teres f. teres]
MRSLFVLAFIALLAQAQQNCKHYTTCKQLRGSPFYQLCIPTTCAEKESTGTTGCGPNEFCKSGACRETTQMKECWTRCCPK